MNLVIKENVQNRIVQLGDVVVVYDTPYQINRENGKFIARSFDGYSGSTGHHESLEKLIESFGKMEWSHYSKDDYELRLVPKDKK